MSYTASTVPPVNIMALSYIVCALNCLCQYVCIFVACQKIWLFIISTSNLFLFVCALSVLVRVYFHVIILCQQIRLFIVSSSNFIIHCQLQMFYYYSNLPGPL